MTYETLTKNALTRHFKATNYKKHVIRNIEIIGQRKIVILGDGDGINGGILRKVIAQLRKKGVRVPEVAFSCTNDERTLDKRDESFKSITALKGMSKAYYVFVTSSYDDLEVYLKGLTGRVGSAKTIEQRLQQLGYTNRDYCLVNEPISFLGTYMKLRAFLFGISDKGQQKKLEKPVRETAAQMQSFKEKYHGKRCFIIGYKAGVHVDRLNVMLNEHCISMNGICSFFGRTPLRPTQYILTDPEFYRGNGKYIEEMECFISSDVKVFRDKFKKPPTYFNLMGDGLIPQLPKFGDTRHKESLRRISDLYVALQLALFEGFTEIYLYGFDGLYDAQITPYEDAIVNDDNNYDIPEDAQTLLKNVKTYAASAGASIYNMSGIIGLDMFDRREFDELEFASASPFGI